MSSSPSPEPRRVALGSTGSIGRQAIDVLAAHPRPSGSWRSPRATTDRPRRTGGAVATGRRRARRRDDDYGTELPADTARESGPDALVELATRADVDLVVVATGGVVSLRSVLAALEAGKTVATANKETLVAGGHLVSAGRSSPRGRRLGGLHADSACLAAPDRLEHSAIWQCLVGEGDAVR